MHCHRSPNPAEFSIPLRGIWFSVAIQGCQRTQIRGCSSSSTFCLLVWGELTQFWHPAFSRELPQPNSLFPETPNLLEKELDEQIGSSKGSKKFKIWEKSTGFTLEHDFCPVQRSHCSFSHSPSQCPRHQRVQHLLLLLVILGKEKKINPTRKNISPFLQLSPQGQDLGQNVSLNFQHSESLVGQ